MNGIYDMFLSVVYSSKFEFIELLKLPQNIHLNLYPYSYFKTF